MRRDGLPGESHGVDCGVYYINVMENFELMNATSPPLNPSSGFQVRLEYKEGAAGSCPVYLTEHLSGLTPPCSWPQTCQFGLFLQHN